MRIAAAASWLHKWLALVVGVQVLFWVTSGLFFALYPIERVRSEHRIAEAAVTPLDPRELPAPAELAAFFPEPPSRIAYERGVRGEALAIVEFADRAPMLIDVATRRLLSPLDEASARAIASTYVADAPAIRSATLVTQESPEYRGALPAWRIAFEDAEGLAVFVAADTGRVTARRSDLWRAYDALWALHIMDWRDHEDFNNGLLVAASLISLIVVIAGFVLFPYRLRFTKR
ncbi:MAG: PepSY domain-containing protein [Hyphomonadaceae bacterium]|nr:PepSY domain-containing protein [Hyphomonadaceae bacterium]